MLKIFISLILISSIKGIAVKERYLEAPLLVSVTAVEPAGLYVQWETVRQRNDDPVIGYKIRIYKIPESSETGIQLINAEEYPGLVKNDKALQDFRLNSTYTDTREVIVKKDNKATISNVEYNTLYEVRVLAFKVDVDGPLSEPMRIKLLHDAEYNTVVTRTLSGCQISVRTEHVQAIDETYPYHYNSYF